MSLDDVRSLWPLKATGFKLLGYFNASNFIEFNETDGNRNNILLAVTAFDTDLAGSSALDIPYFKLLPCEELRLALALDQYQLLNRPRSPCRDDYCRHSKTPKLQAIQVSRPILVLQ